MYLLVYSPHCQDRIVINRGSSFNSHEGLQGIHHERPEYCPMSQGLRISNLIKIVWFTGIGVP